MNNRVPQKHIVVSPKAYDVIKEDSRRKYRSMKATVEMIVTAFYGLGETAAEQDHTSTAGDQRAPSENGR